MMNLEHINKIMKQMEETKKLEAGIQGISEFHEQQDRIFNSIHGMGCDTYYIANGYDGSAKIISNTQFETTTKIEAMAEELYNDIVRHMRNVYGIRDPKVEIKLPVINDPEITINLSAGVHITDVIFNDPATIVFWSDGTKTVVKCCEDDVFDEEKGLTMAICKKTMGSDERFHKVLKKYCKPENKSIPLLSSHASRIEEERLQIFEGIADWYRIAAEASEKCDVETAIKNWSLDLSKLICEWKKNLGIGENTDEINEDQDEVIAIICPDCGTEYYWSPKATNVHDVSKCPLCGKKLALRKECGGKYQK